MNSQRGSFTRVATGVLLSGLAAVVWLGALRAAGACLHPNAPPPEHSSVDVEQSEQNALIYFDDGREHLFLSAGAVPSGDVSGLGWVVPVPDVPDDYGTAAPELFTELGEWTNLRRIVYVGVEKSGLSGAGEGSGSEQHDVRKLEVMKTVETGPYEITPLKARGEAGLKALKRWLKEHGLQVPDSTEPAEYYVERNWTFLAVQVSPPDGSEALDLDGNLRPLYVSFESDRAVYPLKFETNQGEFSVTIHLVTNRAIPDAAFDAIQSKGFWVAGYHGIGEPSSRNEGLGALSEGAGGEMNDAFRESELPPGNCLKPPGKPHKLHYVADHGLVEKEQAPDALVDALDEVDAWEGRSALAIRTLHVPTFNAGRAEPDDWDADFAVPAAGTSPTLTDLMKSDEAPDSGTEEADAIRDSAVPTEFQNARETEESTEATDSEDSSETSKDELLWGLGLLAALLAGFGGWRFFAVAGRRPEWARS